MRLWLGVKTPQAAVPVSPAVPVSRTRGGLDGFLTAAYLQVEAFPGIGVKLGRGPKQVRLKVSKYGPGLEVDIIVGFYVHFRVGGVAVLCPEWQERLGIVPGARVSLTPYRKRSR